MNVYTITLERISTGERAGSMLTRQVSEDAARAYAQDAIRQSPDAGDLGRSDRAGHDGVRRRAGVVAGIAMT